MTDSREKLRALILAALMISSVFGATVAFTGTAAALGNGNVSASPATADGTSTLTYTATTDKERDVQTYQIDFSNANNFDGSFSNVENSDITLNIGGTSYTASSSNSIQEASASNGGATLRFKTGSSITISPGTDITIDVSNFENPSSSGDFEGVLELDPDSGITSRALLAIGSGGDITLDGTVTDPTQVGETVTAEVNDVPDGESVTFEHVVNNQVVNTETKTNDDGSPATLSAEFSAAEDGEVRFSQDGTTFDIEEYFAEELLVNVLNDVEHGTTSDVRGEILVYDGSGGKILADDRNIDYELFDTSGTSIAAGDTDDGEFLITRTFDDKPSADDNNERSDDLDYPSEQAIGDGATDDPAYTVFIQEDPNDDDPGAGPGSNDGSDVVNVRLDVTAGIDDGTVYGDTSDVTGSILNGNDEGVQDYKFAVRDTSGNPTKDAEVVKEQSSTTATNGDFGFTMVFNDAGNWSYGTDVGGNDDGMTAGDGLPDEDEYIEYGTFNIETADANVTLTSAAGNQQSFPADYTLTLRDQDDNLLNIGSGTAFDVDRNSDGDQDNFVAITGEFEASGFSDNGNVQVTDTMSDINSLSLSGDATFLRAADLDGDGNADAIHIVPESDGTTELTVEPLSASTTAQLQSRFVAQSSGLSGPAGDAEIEFTAGIEETTIDTPDTPDLAGSDTATIGAADPVNLIDYDIEDPQDDNGSPTYTNIFEDVGPSQVAVLPLANSPGESPGGERLQANSSGFTYRTGSDQRQNLGGLTQYRIQFEAQDENSDTMVPASTSSSSLDSNEVATMEFINITGAGVNGSIVDDGSGGVDVADGSVNILDADYDDTTPNEYTIIVRPTEVDTADETVDVSLTDIDGNSGGESTEAVGLQVSEFQVDDESVDAVTAGSTVNVTSVVQNGEGEFVNNGRVRLSQTGTSLNADVDARTATTNINNGAYEFSNVDIGPRGIDNNGDGIGEDVSQLTFTAYQYNDADSNGQVDLQQDEVTRATVESLGLEIDDNLEITYLNASNEFAGNKDGTFTVTQGVEYDSLAFQLTDDDDDPVDLTQGLNDETVGLNDLTTTAVSPDGEPLVTMTTSNGGEVQVQFNTDASRPADGYYVIDDLEQIDDGSVDLDGDGIGDNVDTVEGTITTDGSFTFDSGGQPDTSTAFTLSIETPTRDQETNASETGTFNASPPIVNSTVVGVAGSDIEFSDLSEDKFNTNVSGIDTYTMGIDRTYRVNATVTDALGTPLNGSQSDEVIVQFVGDEDAGGDTVVDFSMVDTPMTDAATDRGLGAFAVRASSSSSNIYGYTLEPDSDVEIQNSNGSFVYNIRLTENAASSEFFSGSTYDPPFIVGKQDNFDAAGADDAEENIGESSKYQGEAEGFVTSNEGQRPVVNVFGRNGGDLPENENDATGNDLLAKDIQNQLRIEAFPADENDFVLPDGQQYALTGPKSETTVLTSTQLNSTRDPAVNLATPNFTEGQVGFFSITPTGTGNGIISLVEGDEGAPTGTSVQSPDGDAIVFDVLDSNQQVNLTLSDQTVQANESITVTLVQESDQANDLENVRVDLNDPSGTVIDSEVTDDDGQVTFTIDENATGGTYQVETRPAGFAPATGEFTVDAASTDPDDGSPLDGTAGEFDENGDGSISQSELSDAAFAFASGEVTQSELTDVAFAFASS